MEITTHTALIHFTVVISTHSNLISSNHITKNLHSQYRALTALGPFCHVWWRRLSTGNTASQEFHLSWNYIIPDRCNPAEDGLDVWNVSNTGGEWIVENKTTVLPPDQWASLCAGLLIGHTINFILHRASALCVCTMCTTWHSCTALHAWPSYCG